MDKHSAWNSGTEFASQVRGNSDAALPMVGTGIRKQSVPVEVHPHGSGISVGLGSNAIGGRPDVSKDSFQGSQVSNSEVKNTNRLGLVEEMTETVTDPNMRSLVGNSGHDDKSNLAAGNGNIGSVGSEQNRGHGGRTPPSLGIRNGSKSHGDSVLADKSGVGGPSDLPDQRGKRPLPHRRSPSEPQTSDVSGWETEEIDETGTPRALAMKTDVFGRMTDDRFGMGKLKTLNPERKKITGLALGVLPKRTGFSTQVASLGRDYRTPSTSRVLEQSNLDLREEVARLRQKCVQMGYDLISAQRDADVHRRKFEASLENREIYSRDSQQALEQAMTQLKDKDSRIVQLQKEIDVLKKGTLPVSTPDNAQAAASTSTVACKNCERNQVYANLYRDKYRHEREEHKLSVQEIGYDLVTANEQVRTLTDQLTQLGDSEAENIQGAYAKVKQKLLQMLPNSVPADLPLKDVLTLIRTAVQNQGKISETTVNRYRNEISNLEATIEQDNEQILSMSGTIDQLRESLDSKRNEVRTLEHELDTLPQSNISEERLTLLHEAERKYMLLSAQCTFLFQTKGIPPKFDLELLPQEFRNKLRLRPSDMTLTQSNLDSNTVGTSQRLLQSMDTGQKSQNPSLTQQDLTSVMPAYTARQQTMPILTTALPRPTPGQQTTRLLTSGLSSVDSRQPISTRNADHIGNNSGFLQGIRLPNPNSRTQTYVNSNLKSEAGRFRFDESMGSTTHSGLSDPASLSAYVQGFETVQPVNSPQRFGFYSQHEPLEPSGKQNGPQADNGNGNDVSSQTGNLTPETRKEFTRDFHRDLCRVLDQLNQSQNPPDGNPSDGSNGHGNGASNGGNMPRPSTPSPPISRGGRTYNRPPPSARRKMGRLSNLDPFDLENKRATRLQWHHWLYTFKQYAHVIYPGILDDPTETAGLLKLNLKGEHRWRAVSNFINEAEMTSSAPPSLDEISRFIQEEILPPLDSLKARDTIRTIRWRGSQETLREYKERLIHAFQEALGGMEISSTDRVRIAEAFLLGLPEDFRDDALKSGADEKDIDDLLTKAERFEKIKRHLQFQREAIQRNTGRKPSTDLVQSKGKKGSPDKTQKSKPGNFSRDSRNKFPKSSGSSTSANSRGKSERFRPKDRYRNFGEKRKDRPPSTDHSIQSADTQKERQSPSQKQETPRDSSRRTNNSEKRNEVKKPSSNSSRGSKSDSLCYGCRRRGHFKSNCPNTDVECTKCHKKGHFRSECDKVQEALRVLLARDYGIEVTMSDSNDSNYYYYEMEDDDCDANMFTVFESTTSDEEDGNLCPPTPNNSLADSYSGTRDGYLVGNFVGNSSSYTDTSHSSSNECSDTDGSNEWNPGFEADVDEGNHESCGNSREQSSDESYTDSEFLPSESSSDSYPCGYTIPPHFQGYPFTDSEQGYFWSDYTSESLPSLRSSHDSAYQPSESLEDSETSSSPLPEDPNQSFQQSQVRWVSDHSSISLSSTDNEYPRGTGRTVRSDEERRFQSALASKTVTGPSSTNRYRQATKPPIFPNARKSSNLNIRPK